MPSTHAPSIFQRLPGERPLSNTNPFRSPQVPSEVVVTVDDASPTENCELASPIRQDGSGVAEIQAVSEFLHGGLKVRMGFKMKAVLSTGLVLTLISSIGSTVLQGKHPEILGTVDRQFSMMTCLC